ncbi:MAG: hypothetical protein Q8934_05970 [Bacillota bacterium]|nr:hypothetical protein [Bacillota bacterium]
MRVKILWIWKLFDPFFYFCSRLHYIQPMKTSQSVFRVRVTEYKGKEMILSDGVRINKHDLLLKIHLHNVRLLFDLLKVKNDIQRARLLYKVVLYSMPALAKYLKAHQKENCIKGIIGITMVNKGVKHLGFECFFPSNRFYRWIKKMGQLPISFLSVSSIKSIRKHNITYLVMSKEKLYQTYLKETQFKNNELFTTYKPIQKVKN